MKALARVMRKCRVCGCSEKERCETYNGPCYWSEIDAALCTVCEDAVDALVDWWSSVREPSRGGPELINAFFARLAVIETAAALEPKK